MREQHSCKIRLLKLTLKSELWNKVWQQGGKLSPDLPCQQVLMTLSFSVHLHVNTNLKCCTSVPFKEVCRKLQKLLYFHQFWERGFIPRNLTEDAKYLASGKCRKRVSLQKPVPLSLRADSSLYWSGVAPRASFSYWCEIWATAFPTGAFNTTCLCGVTAQAKVPLRNFRGGGIWVFL